MSSKSKRKGTGIACNLCSSNGHFSGAGEEDRLLAGEEEDKEMGQHQIRTRRMMGAKTLLHPESPHRLHAIVDRLKSSGLWSKCHIVDEAECTADEGDLRLIHGGDYIAAMLSTAEKTEEELIRMSEPFDSAYLSPGTSAAALSAVGCCRELARLIVEGNINNGFALVRPPGHHAQPSTANGYSIFNNAASAAEAAFAFGAERILIVDFDVHHGQGTQQMFYDQDRVLYMSIHRHENGAFWPHLRMSEFDFVGEGPGAGYNVNVPLNEGKMNVSPTLFAHLIYHLQLFAKGRLLMVLEGGYNYHNLSICVEKCVDVLVGGVPDPLRDLGAPKRSTIASILNVAAVHAKFWRCFDFWPVIDGKSAKSNTSDMELELTEWQIYRPEVKFEVSVGVSTPTGKLDQWSLAISSESSIDSIGPQASCSKTGLFYDELMERHVNEGDAHHPECPQRVARIFDGLKKSCLADRCAPVKLRRATDRELTAVHNKGLLEMLSLLKDVDQQKRRSVENNFNSVFFSEHSEDSARIAAGGLLQCVDDVLCGRLLNAFACVRPPGHHATESEPYGFCLYNSVAVAAQYALDTYKLNKVLVVDWDVHHGNGTQDSFYQDPRVLYLSIHRYEHGSFFPSHANSNFFDSGVDEGLGFNVNVPWSDSTMGDAEYMAAFSKVVMPIAYEFCPDLVLVSCGFDAAAGDPLGGYQVGPEAYWKMTHMLCGLARGKIVLALEGGYNLKSISNSAIACVQRLTGTQFDSQALQSGPTPRKSPKRIIAPVVCTPAWKTLRQVCCEQAKYWNCLKGMQRTLERQKMSHEKSALTDLTAALNSLSVETASEPKGPSPQRSPRGKNA